MHQSQERPLTEVGWACPLESTDVATPLSQTNSFDILCDESLSVLISVGPGPPSVTRLLFHLPVPPVSPTVSVA